MTGCVPATKVLVQGILEWLPPSDVMWCLFDGLFPETLGHCCGLWGELRVRQGVQSPGLHGKHLVEQPAGVSWKPVTRGMAIGALGSPWGKLQIALSWFLLPASSRHQLLALAHCFECC